MTFISPQNIEIEKCHLKLERKQPIRIGLDNCFIFIDNFIFHISKML